ncbi:hypothetical protein RF11_15984 [Thelohanellus kitauei]|uniref:Uncharacterized protein n=1 Tax=Thelohanellus kitauei TaxID=669202 RepID=A0A0C2MQ96_THEKT|nr:hypothetical protein RF11_15984 [Thelohanellus kitauei]
MGGNPTQILQIGFDRRVHTHPSELNIKIYQVSFNPSNDEMHDDEAEYTLTRISGTCNGKLALSKLTDEPGYHSVFFISLSFGESKHGHTVEKFHIRHDEGYEAVDYIVPGLKGLVWINVSAKDSVSNFGPSHATVENVQPGEVLKENFVYSISFFVSS